jgi:hypothetical protein
MINSMQHARTRVALLGACERGGIDKDFGILLIVFVAGLYFIYAGVSQYYNAFGGVLTSVIR